MTDHPKNSPEAAPSLHSKWRRWWKAGAILFGLTAAALMFGGWQLSKAYGARAAKYDLRKLREISTATMVLDRSGQPLGSLNDNNRGFVRLDALPPHVIDALIATEDSRFYRHHGVDYVGIARAMVKNLAHLSVKQGGSTITQQLARQTFSLKGRTFDRKLLETFVARRIEKSFSKSEILECYLNRIYLGHGFYGVGAAARGYFGKDVKDLTLQEGALLVGIIKAPVPYSPFRNPDAARRVRDLTLKRMHRLEMIDSGTLASAQGLPLGILEEGARLGRQNYALAAVEEELETLARTGQGGPWKTVSVTVDGALQAKISALVSEHVARIESKLPSADQKEAAPSGKLQAAVVILDNRTGTVLATCGGRDYITSPFDRASQGLRPAGTAFLPLSYAAILTVRPEIASSLVLDGPMDNRRVMIGGEEGLLGEWAAETTTPRYEGYLPALDGLRRGKTGATVRLAMEAGLQDVWARLKDCGFTSSLPEYPSVVLGHSPVRLMDLARAYVALTASGELPPATPLVTAAIAERGTHQPTAESARKTSPLTVAAADQIRKILVQHLRRPEFQSELRVHQLEGQFIAGWGGTAHGLTDAWFIGGDRHRTCAVWIGYDETKTIGSEAWSRTIAFPLWAQALAAATAGKVEGWPADHEPPSQTPVPSSRIDLAQEVAPLKASPASASTPPPPPSEARPISPKEPALAGRDPYQAYIRSESSAP